ncbi:Retrovirus-related Pol polyprotein from transposon opus [Vitis vinifera]|uniref:RNA-directed DNA polymerase n=1 Tax=Vitis vinifera TaxID=29760 RepID=A0A438G4V0_VITVI|nr:Retrovirus-related Pol polyprotein from transposon opus [Vitis vinifera]
MGKKPIKNAYEILDVLRQVKVNIPLLDMIKQVPTYAKFLKDLCTVKRGLNVTKQAFLTEQVSAIIQCKSPIKYKDPGCPTISVNIGGTQVEKALLDLGASVNLLPYSVYKELGLGELKPTSITLSLADRSVKIPRGVIEDVFVQVDKFYYPVDFVEWGHATHFWEYDIGTHIFHLCQKHIHPEEDEGPEEVCMIDTLVEEHCNKSMLDQFEENPYESHEDRDDGMRKRLKGAKDAILKVELKTLPAELKYAYLEEGNKAPGISPLICMHHIYMEEGAKPTRQPQRRLNPHMQEVVRAEVLKLLQAGIIYPISDSTWVSPTQVVPKKSGITVVKGENGDEVSTRLTTGWRVCIDYKKLNTVMRKDHFPLPFMDQRLLWRTMRRLPSLVHSAPMLIGGCLLDYATLLLPSKDACFSILSDMVEQIMEVFMDDITVYGTSFEDCLSHLEDVLKRCIEKDLVLNWEKCHFMVNQGIVLGHVISNKGIEVDRAKVELILKLPPPTNVKGIRQFLGHAGMPSLSGMINVKGVLSFLSNLDISAPLNYTTTEKELLAVVYALDKFRAYLIGSSIVVDAFAQEFNLQIKDKKGVENVVADHLSRLNIAHDTHGLPINDDFPEESLMLVEEVPWFAHIANYLVTGEIPSEWSSQDKKNFFAKVHAYYWRSLFSSSHELKAQDAMNNSRLCCLLRALNARNRSRLWWTSMTLGHELRALDVMNNSRAPNAMNSSSLWMICATPSHELKGMDALNNSTLWMILKTRAPMSSSL